MTGGRGMISGALTGAVVEGRRAVRGLTGSPGFSIGVVLVLGISIAGMVTVATAAWELFLKPLPFPHAEQLVQIGMRSRVFGNMEVGFAPAMLSDVREQPMVADVAAYQFPSTLQSKQGEDWRAAAVTHNLADVLGVHPFAGRAFVPADAESAAPRVALIGERAWRVRFNADEAVLGSELALSDGPVRIVGIMPAAFRVP